MEARAAAAAAAHRRVKRAMGLLRAAAAALAPDVDELDLVAELHIDAGAGLEPVLEALELARARGHRGALDVVILASPAEQLLPASALGDPPGTPDPMPPE